MSALPLLLVHGAGEDHLVWAPLIDALAEVAGGHEIIAPSLPGRCGVAGPPLADATAIADWLAALLTARGIERAIVFGHSYGGACAIELALRHPGVVAALVLMSTGARLRVSPAILAAMENVVDDAAARTPAATALADWRGCDRFDRLHEVAALRAPTLIIGGDADVLTPPKYARFLADKIAGSELVMLAGAGHDLPFVRAAEVARAAGRLIRRVRARSYDVVARDYAAKYGDELAGKPLDRALLDAFAELVRDRGRCLEVGSGPGHVAAYLADRGVEIEASDISPGMVEAARQRYVSLPCRVADMCALRDSDASLAGICAFYAIVHTPPDEIPALAAEWARVLAPGGRVIVSFHVGAERVHVDQFLGHAVALDFQFHDRAQVEAAFEAAGITIDARLERRGDPAVEHPSMRAYLIGRRA